MQWIRKNQYNGYSKQYNVISYYWNVLPVFLERSKTITLDIFITGHAKKVDNTRKAEVFPVCEAATVRQYTGQEKLGARSFRPPTVHLK